MPSRLMPFLPAGGTLAVSLSDAANDNAFDALDPKVLDMLGRAIRAYCDDLIRAPLPENVLDLLSRLEAEEAERKSEGKPDASGQLQR